MNPTSESAAKRLFVDVRKGIQRVHGVDVVVAPPTIYIHALTGAHAKTPLVGSQDVFWERLGPRTGNISPRMLKNAGVTHSIIGHSEKRALGETDEQVNKKVHAILKDGLTPIVCVGEKKRDQGAHYLGIVEEQVRKVVAGVTRTKLATVVIAYEPIWAIGTGDTATPADAHEMKLFIQKILTEIYGRSVASKVRIIYGGSVNAKNAEELLTLGAVDGFLVGGASLRGSEFVDIVRITERTYEVRTS